MIPMLITAVALIQFAAFGINIFTMLIGFVLAVLAGIIGGSRNNSNRSTRDSDNLAMIAQIERNKYFGK